MYKKLLSLFLSISMLSAFAVVPTVSAATDPVVIKVEAETFKRNGNPIEKGNINVELGDLSNYQGADNPGSITCEVYAPKAGTYTLETYGYELNGDTLQSSHAVVINGTKYPASAFGTPEALPLPYPQTNCWGINRVNVILQEGKNTIEFTDFTQHFGNYLFWMDYIKFVEVTSTTYRTEFENLSITGVTNSKLANQGACSGTGQNHSILIIACATGETKDIELKVNVPVAGRYKFLISANDPNTTATDQSKYTISYGGNALDLQIQPKTNYYQSYAAEVELTAGENTFTVTGQKRSLSDHVCIYGDFYEVSYLGAEEEVSGEIIIEAETFANPGELVTYNNFTQDVASGGGAIALGDESPLEVIYTAQVSAAGEYGLNIVLSSHDNSFMSPVKITVKQGDNKLLDNVWVAPVGTFTIYPPSAESSSVTVAESDPHFTKSASLYTAAFASQGMHSYEYDGKLTLDEGSLDVILKVETYPKDINTQNLFVADVIKFSKDADYTTPTIKGAKTLMYSGDTATLSAVDAFGTTLDPTAATIAWSSSDNDVISVSDEGVVTANRYGNATITLSVTKDGTTKTDTVDVVVYDGTYKFVIDDATLSGNTVTVDYLTHADLTGKTVTLIVAEFSGNTLLEVKSAAITDAAQYNYGSTTITLDDVTGDVKMFVWDSVDGMTPVLNMRELN